MGIYIKGMEMPTKCEECNKIFRFCQTEEDGSVWCFIAKGYLGEESTKCPLVPVPDITQVDLGVFIEGKVKTFDIPKPKEETE